MTLKKLYEPKPMRLAIFMSGSGSNAKKIIEKYLKQRNEGMAFFKPLLIFTDNPDSNALKISCDEYKEEGFMINLHCHPIKEFYKRKGYDDLKSIDVRAEYDKDQHDTLKDYGIDVIALAGYDWVVTPILCDNFLTVNVHPGDLRVKFPEEHKNAGKRRYIGLGWVPSAKAIINGEEKVYTSVHLVTSELDGGQLLAVSAPQKVQEEVRSLEDRTVLLGEAKNISDISKYIRNNPDMNDEELYKRFPICRFAKDCQERLKIHGDWIVFPEVITYLAQGRYSKDEKGGIYFDGKAIPDGLNFGE